MSIIPAKTLQDIDKSDFRVSGACAAAEALFDPNTHDARVVLYNPATSEWRLFRFHTVQRGDGTSYRIVSKYTGGKWHGFAWVGNRGDVMIFRRYSKTPKLSKYAKLMNNLDGCRGAGLQILIEVRCPISGRSLTTLESVDIAYGPKAVAA